MARISSNGGSLIWKSIDESVEDTIAYLDGRRKGTIKSLKTSKKKLNSALLDGIEWGRILTFAGLSGTGKSIALEEIKRDLVDYNPEERFKILSFEFEMLPIDQIARNLSGKTELSVKDLYSGTTPIGDAQFSKIRSIANTIKKYPIYYVEQIGNVDQIVNTIIKFWNDQDLINKGEGLIVTIDHILLTKGKSGEGEKTTIDELAHGLVELKKLATSLGLKLTIIMLAQLNRSIESPERVLNPMLHYPTKNDIFGASSVYYCSDYVIITHKPAVIEGIGEYYGPPRVGYPRGLPVFNPKNTTQPMIYWHLIKARFGNNCIMMLLDDFKNSRITEYD